MQNLKNLIALYFLVSLFGSRNHNLCSQSQTSQRPQSRPLNNFQSFVAEGRSEIEQSRPQSSLQSGGTSNNHTFPCLHPINPHMRSREARLQTFLDHCTVWPAHRIRASPQQIVDAGMFYLGNGDRVKCWYCNGGLQNWEREDVPWEEHAKWFPMCEYLLQQKGPSYVRDVVYKFPNLRRPVLLNASTAPAANQLIDRAQTRTRYAVLFLKMK